MFRHAVTISVILLVTACSGDKKPAAPSTPAATTPKPKPADAAPATAAAPLDAAVAAVPAEADAAPTAAAAPVDAGADPGGKPKPKKELKDIKVLAKTWTYDQVDKYMETEIAAGLGQKCVFCHDEKNFAADKPHKTIAREMITMTAGLNKKFFGGKPRIKCITCHKGKAEPEPR